MLCLMSPHGNSELDEYHTKQRRKVWRIQNKAHHNYDMELRSHIYSGEIQPDLETK